MLRTMSNGAFWGTWSAVATVTTVALLYFSWAGVSAVLDRQVLIGVDEPPRKMELPEGENSIYFQYSGPPPGTYRHVIYPELNCTVTVSRTGVPVQVNPSATRDAYKLGKTVGVRMVDFVVRAPGEHAVACSLAQPFPDERPIQLAVGKDMVSRVFMAMLPPLLGFFVVGGLLAVAIWLRIRGTR